MNTLWDCGSVGTSARCASAPGNLDHTAKRLVHTQAQPRRAKGALSALLFALACGLTTDATAIHLGLADFSGQFAGIGLLTPPASRDPCTGTMLSDNVFLTAAQCVVNLTPASGLQFSLGAGMTAQVTEIRPHPGFATVDGINPAFDIALVGLNGTDVAGWSGVPHWAIDAAAPSVGSAVTSVGFGETGNGVGGGVRRSGAVSISQYIGAEGPIGVFVPDGFIETIPVDELGQTFCRGDVGGPLLANNKIVGVASFRFVASCDESGPGYYVNVQRFTGWIGENLVEMDAQRNVPEPPPVALLMVVLVALGLARRGTKV